MIKNTIILFSILFVTAIVFALLGWGVDGFDFFVSQKNRYYFQSWISIAGGIFTFIMSVTTFYIYKKNNIASLKFISLSLLFSSVAYFIIGYHASYCKVCSDLSMCAASHNYPNYFIVISLIIMIVTILLSNIQKNLKSLKQFSYALIISTTLLMVVLFLSIQYMETPDIMAYVFSNINLQGFIFIFPIIFIFLSFIYIRSIYSFTNVTKFILLLIIISFVPQALHIFSCNECDIMECSEFYAFAGLLMFMVIGSLVYAISLQLEKKI